MNRWFQHLRWWLRGFPRANEGMHLWTSVLGDVEEQCLACGAKQVKSQEELTWDLEILEKHPEWKDAEVDE